MAIDPGDHSDRNFKDDDDRRRRFFTLGEACAKTEWQVQAHGRMRNDFYFLIQTPRANPVARMKWLLGFYTKRFGFGLGKLNLGVSAFESSRSPTVRCQLAVPLAQGQAD